MSVPRHSVVFRARVLSPGPGAADGLIVCATVYGAPAEATLLRSVSLIEAPSRPDWAIALGGRSA